MKANEERITEMRGYKVFNPDWTCKDFKYEVGNTYEMDETPKCCSIGFHFCTDLKDCFNYYSFDANNKVAEIEALGEICQEADGSKSCTNKIKIVREIPWEEVLRMVNIGKYNSGLRNIGNHNSGNRNIGNHNSGDCNICDYNTGNWNSGGCNTGNRNSGNRNTGYCNSGDYNSGDYNSGDFNSSHWNSGDFNSGYSNSGDCNSGNCNSGDFNSGNRNSGNHNSGDRNSGDWNTANFSSGCFNTKESKIFMFNKPSDWTLTDWMDSEARFLLNGIRNNVLEWIEDDDMTDEEKEHHPEYVTTGGYLKELDKSECGQIWWDSLNDIEKEIIKDIPNFDKSIFEKITGVKIDE